MPSRAISDGEYPSSKTASYIWIIDRGTRPFTTVSFCATSTHLCR
jgi:hypothetical protein